MKNNTFRLLCVVEPLAEIVLSYCELDPLEQQQNSNQNSKILNQIIK